MAISADDSHTAPQIVVHYSTCILLYKTNDGVLECQLHARLRTLAAAQTRGKTIEWLSPKVRRAEKFGMTGHNDPHRDAHRLNERLTTAAGGSRIAMKMGSTI